MPSKADTAVASSTVPSETQLFLIINHLTVLTLDPLEQWSILKESQEVIQRVDTAWSEVLRQTFTNIIPVK